MGVGAGGGADVAGNGGMAVAESIFRPLFLIDFSCDAV